MSEHFGEAKDDYDVLNQVAEALLDVNDEDGDEGRFTVHTITGGTIIFSDDEDGEMYNLTLNEGLVREEKYSAQEMIRIIDWMAQELWGDEEGVLWTRVEYSGRYWITSVNRGEGHTLVSSMGRETMEQALMDLFHQVHRQHPERKQRKVRKRCSLKGR